MISVAVLIFLARRSMDKEPPVYFSTNPSLASLAFGFHLSPFTFPLTFPHRHTVKI